MALQLFRGARMSIPKADLSHEKPTSPLTSNVISKSLFWKVPVDRQRFISSIGFQKQPLHVMASQNTSVATSADTSDKNSSGPLQKNVQQSTFPIAFQALVEDVCEQTQIAELKLKIGDFEMFLKRDIGISSAPSPVYAPVESSITAPPILSEPMEETATSPTPFLEQVSTEETSSPFVNISAAKTLKLASLEASGHDAFVIVASPLVGTFQRGRTIKGKRLPPSCKEGAVIKEGQIIGFLGQCGNELPIRSDVDGEVLKILYEDGEAVGYGDPLVAVLPSFHAIN
ncbi:biotin carboxyl carrier protein of acetyl-CoA carboxylase-like [Zingiber officinale]|uniref:biotin carboxyl carrier protein of acetyl-CoA carboxylase-like n=1 Tax=Zingiber officinale TaxID=94328 RepID=UPI001C4B687B|nr:biotin carboxyl carrier protein of acetyl-CoA carboxylase-like [Zingiber officinale]